MQKMPVLALVALLVTATTSADPMPASGAAGQLVELDRQLNQAIVSHDMARASAHYDDDFVLTVSGGGFTRKADMLAGHASPAKPPAATGR